MSFSPRSPQPTPIHKSKTSSVPNAQDKCYRNLSRFPQMEVNPPIHGLPSLWSQASHVIHHCSSPSLTTNQTPSKVYPLGGSKKLSRHWLQDPGNSHQPAPLVPSLGVLKFLTPTLWLWAFAPGLSALAGPLLSPRLMICLATTCLDCTTGRRLWPQSPSSSLLLGEGGSAHPLPGFCHQRRRIRQASNWYCFYTFSPPL